jgi:hypothetical protein
MPGTLGPGIGYGKAARFMYIATAAQVTFSGADSSAQALTMSYTPGYVEVIVNGKWLPPQDYTATNGSSVVLNSGCIAGDIVYVYVLSVLSVANTYDKTQNGADILSPTTFRANIGLGSVGHETGIASNSAAAAGEIGEVFVASGTSASLTTAVAVALGSVSPTAGDWDITFSLETNTSGGTSVTDWSATMSTSSASMGTPIANSIAMHERVAAMADHSFCMSHGPVQLLINATTQVFLNFQASFTGTAPNVTWTLKARRMR